MSQSKNPDFSILMVDDELPWLRSLGMTLEGPGGFTNLISCSDSREVPELFEQHDIGLVLLDLTMPHISGEELLRRINEEYPDVQVIILSGMNQLETAVGCMRLGAFDYFVKTVEEDRLLDGIRRAVRMVELQRENQAIRRRLFKKQLEHPEVFAPLVTRDAAMLAIFGYLESVSASRQPLLILGESGVGKELVARAAHQLGGGDGPLVSVNVAGLDDNVFADTLFGHRRGAFTGADRERPGMIERASGGTLFLDEIGDLSAASQVKLLRLLQEGEYYPLGSDSPCQLQARVICATHHDLAEMVRERSFRKDLYYRLHAHQVNIPPLRERKEDLPLLLQHFLESAAAELEKPVPTAPPELISLLNTYSFPGNIRELQAMVHDAVSQHPGGVLSCDVFQRRIGDARQTGGLVPARNPFTVLDDLPTLAEAGDLLVDAALERAGNNQTLAARLLGISQPALSKRLKQRREHA
ncbi:sigma-54-dependent transcriptional regulator [Geothermobacter hydrogeniphilus]|uniref:Two-component system response regulator n=1 Tax=Geothermobacter hydrogeniphilus TaxID=1969733 RepID=A0A1X0XXF5_9BACT|nr:sigma-54 dependent transcriptional regulator [Geothermobacter hydrogeniphilus]ORJ57594.1 two-component system response regulator [Geothermobacter hydrogeniphilus]